MSKEPQRSITQLDFERRWMLAKLDHGGNNDDEAQSLIRRIEDLDLAIAASPSETLVDLRIKIERLYTELLPTDVGQEGCLEHVLLAAILSDAVKLTDEA